MREALRPLLHRARLAALLILLLAGAGSAARQAAESATDPGSGAAPGDKAVAGADESAADGDAREPPPAETDRRRPAPASPDVFVPTEEVSEDLSVAFPVDI